MIRTHHGRSSPQTAPQVRGARRARPGRPGGTVARERAVGDHLRLARQLRHLERHGEDLPRLPDRGGRPAARPGAPTFHRAALRHVDGHRDRDRSLVRWASTYNASNGTGRIARCRTPSLVPRPVLLVESRHLPGLGLRALRRRHDRNPTRALSHWLCEDSAQPGVLVPTDLPTAVPLPVYYVTQPPSRRATRRSSWSRSRRPACRSTGLYGEAQWIRIFVKKLPNG